MVFAAAPLNAQAFEDLTALDARLSRLDDVVARPLDPRLKLAACPAPAIIDPPALGAVAVRCPALGWRIRVPLVTTPTASTKPPIIVRRGDIVALKIMGNGFELTTSGTAVDDAATGQNVRIKTSASTAPLTATATGPGNAEAIR